MSDAGKPFQILSDAALGFVGQSMRATDILWDRVWQLEREHFSKQKGFVFLPITEVVEPADDPTALHPVIQAEVQSIRTDLDRFSDLEVNALVQHGYEVARKICRQTATRCGLRVPLGRRVSSRTFFNPVRLRPLPETNSPNRSVTNTSKLRLC